MSKSNQINDPISYLKSVDPVLGQVIRKVPRLEWEKTTDHFLRLVREIINQQLSDKASATITNRFLELFPNRTATPQSVLKISTEKIRKAGISYAKVSYIKDLAKRKIEGSLDLDRIHTFNDEEVIIHLTQVKGIGRWTAEMFLMFSLRREDIFSYGDLGLRNAIKKLYKLRNTPTEKQAAKISSKWKPYRSWASRYLWASLEL